MAPQRAVSRTTETESDVIEISSGSESEFEDSEDSGAGTEQEPPVEKALVEDSQDKFDSAPEPSPRSRRLPVRGKDGRVKPHKSFSLKLPVSSYSRDQEIQDSQELDGDDGGSDVLQSRPKSRPTSSDDDQDEEFVTPEEDVPRNPLETAVIRAAEVAREDEEDESDDDAPPEAISSRAAHVELTKTKQAALRAVRMQDGVLKRKRQDHNVLLRQQALGRQTAKKDSQPVKIADPDTTRMVGETSFKSGAKMPELLPPELLASDDEDDAPASRVRPESQSKKIKFEEAERKLARESRPARDERVGSIIYRVVASKGDQRVAPRTSAHSSALKMQLLARKRTRRKKPGFMAKN